MSYSEDWRLGNECFPFEDDHSLYIVIESEYETPGNEKDKRLSEAVLDGVFKLLRFYGKDTTAVYDLSGTSLAKEYYVSLRPCVRMRVLVSVPKNEFELISDDPSSCNVNKPAEGYLSAFVDVATVTQQIETAASGIESLIPKLIKSDKFISNVNIPREVKRLRAAGRAIRRYIDLNNIAPQTPLDPECVQPNEVDRTLEIGFTFDYNAVFALVDEEQYTIGYDCFLQSSELNHITSINYLTRLNSIIEGLQLKNEASFSVFDFLSKHTLPTPVIETKQSSLDGLDKYDENGNLFSFANIAKLLTLDLDIDLCKTDEEKAKEDKELWNSQIRREVAKTTRETSEFVGNMKLSTGGVEKLRRRLRGVKHSVTSDGGEFGFKGQEAVGIIYNDVMAKVDLGCVLEETIQCLLENSISEFGEWALNDPDLEKVLRVQSVTGLSDGNCDVKKCDGTPDIGWKIGLPAFQGINIPSNFPTTDWLAESMDAALVSLYNTLISSLTSLILGILEGLCELLFSYPDGFSRISEGFKSWFSQTLGINIDDLSNPDTWSAALTSAGGKGFLGVIGNTVAKMEGSLSSAYSETGIAVRIPNPETGEIEEKFISPEFLVSLMSEISTAVDDMEAVLSETESQAVLKGTATDEVVEVCYKCVTRNGSNIFQSKEDFVDIMSGIGNMVQPKFLTQKIDEQNSISSNICDIGDGSNQKILRETLLQEKDSSLSSEEVEEILNKEKQRKKNRILAASETLEMYKAGRLAPSFPNIFGEGGLIPETPPVIEELNNLISRASFDSVITNFSIESSEYPKIWTSLFNDNSPMEPFDSIIVNSNSGRYRLGYTPESKETVPTAEYNAYTLGPYAFGSDIDITGIAKEGSTKNPYGGEEKDDALFEKLVKDLEPYVASSTHTFGNERFKSPFAKSIGGSRSLGHTGDQVGTFDATNGISGARAYAYLLMKEMDTYQEGGDVDSPSTNPYWGEVFKGQDNQIFDLTVSYDGINVTVIVKTYLGEEPADIVRDTAWYNNLVEVEVNAYGTETKPLSLRQTSEDYYISNNASFIGRQVSTGRLNTQEYKYSNLSLDTLTDVVNPEITYGADSNEEVLYEWAELIAGRNIREGILEQFATHIASGKYSSLFTNAYSPIQAISLTYPKNDILDYSSLIDFSSDFSSFLISKSLSGEYCDTISTIRRANAITGVRMLVRLFIVERALASIQVLNGFDIAFMENDLFASSLYKIFKTEMKEYENSFDNIEGSLFSDIKSNALKYYEILNSGGGNVEIPATEKDALKRMFSEEIENLIQPIIDNLKLKWDSSTWDGFLIKVIFGEIDDLDEVYSKDTILSFGTGGESFVFKRDKTEGKSETIYSYSLSYVKLEQDGTNLNIVDLPVISVECSGENLEVSVDPVSSEIEAIVKEYGPYNFGKKVSLGMFGEKPDVLLANTMSSEIPVGKNVAITPALEWLKEKSESDADKDNADKTGSRYIKKRAYYLGDIDYDWIADITYPLRDTASREKYDQEIFITIVATDSTPIREAEEKREAEITEEEAKIAEKENEIYSNLRDMMIETREYQVLFNDILPIKDMISSLSLYEYCALSDTTVYPEVSEAGINLADMLVKTKLSTLQIFASSIYGSKKISYTDPFLEKAGTDNVA